MNVTLCNVNRILHVSGTYCSMKLPIAPMLHTSAALCRKKKSKPFYNMYYKQLQNRYKMNTSFTHDVIEKQRERSQELTDTEFEIDHEEELLAEARNRRNAYRYAKKVKDFTKGPGLRLLTWSQMEHVRFLRQEYPDEWSYETLAHSFQVPKDVIRKVLRSNRILHPHLQQKLDAKVKQNWGVKRLPSPLIEEDKVDKSTTSLVVSEPENDIETKTSWGLPEWRGAGWFSNYDSAVMKIDKTVNKKKSSNYSKEKKLPEITWLDDEDCEFYSFLYYEDEFQDGDGTFGIEESSEENSEEDEELTKLYTTTRTDDGMNFYNDVGDFLYKV